MCPEGGYGDKEKKKMNRLKEFFAPTIYWSHRPKTYLSPAGYEAKLAELKETGIDITASKTKKSDWYIEGKTTYHESAKGKYRTLYVAEWHDGIHSPYTAVCNTLQGKQGAEMQEEMSGSKAGSLMRKAFREATGCTVCSAFGTVSSDEYMACVPKPIYYLNQVYTGQEIASVGMIDNCSMYPGSMTGKLPDAHTAVRIAGYARPTEEYPFAFYLTSHNCAEYGVFDTHDYVYRGNAFGLLSRKNGQPMYRRVSNDEEVTVLMKPSKYTWDKAIEGIFARKLAGDKVAKAILNKGIGSLHRNPKGMKREVDSLNLYYHICAIILGRANAKQLSMYDTIHNNGGRVITMIVDSIVYVGNKEYGTTDKQLGKFHQDYTDCHFISADAVNRYVIWDDDGIKKCVVGGIENPTINQPKDILNYMRRLRVVNTIGRKNK